VTGGDAAPLDGEGATDREKVARYLADLSRFGEQARQLVSEGREAYLARTFDGERSRGFGEHIVLNIATVAERLPEWFKESHPDVGWQALKGMRNLIAHVHDGVDDELVWRALENRVPRMIAQLVDPEQSSLH
jgi:broad specificity phosphatase PhoE